MTLHERRTPNLRVWRDLLEQHLDEASFLWSQRQMGLLAPNWSLRELARQEERLLAHVDGLVLGGEPVAEALLRPALSAGDQARMAAAAFALLEGMDAGMEAVLEQLRTGSSTQRLILCCVLELSQRDRLGMRLRELLATEDVELVALVLEVLGARGELPDNVVESMLCSKESRLQVAILRAAMGRPSALRRERVAPLLSSPHVDVRIAAIEVGLVARRQEAWAACLREVKDLEEGHQDAMLLLALGGDSRDVTLVVEQLSNPELRAFALWVLGFSGWRTAADVCLEWVGDKDVGPVAGESFSAITGFRLQDALTLPPERRHAEEPISLDEDDLDADLSLRPEDSLIRPAEKAVSDWWEHARGRFDQEFRYLHGQPFDAGVLLDALTNDSMRRRHVLAREFRLRSQGIAGVRTWALAHIQREDLDRAALHARSMPMGPLKHMVR